MSRHSFDTAELRELEGTLAELVRYCADLEAHAAGASASAGGQWSGVASVEFQGRVQTWQAGAEALRLLAEDLQVWAGAAATSYESSQSQTSSMWVG